MDGAIAEFGAEPVAWIVHARTGDQLTADGDYVANAEGILGLHSTPLYAAPQQAPVVVDEIAEQAGIDPDIADAYMQGVNDTNQRKLADIIPSVIPEGLTGQIVYLCAFDNMPRHELATRIYNVCRDAIVHAELSIRKDCPWCNGDGYVDIDHGFEMGVEQKECRHCRAAMLQAGNHTEQHLDMVDHSGDANEKVDCRLPFAQWLSQQNEPIDVDCGCVTTEAFYHWLRVAYEAGNSPV
ncbi:hypothetical protein QNN87_26230, partial [Citrobacter sp. C411]